MPADPPFVSFAQNREDVVLWRALRHVAHGRYVEVGANHPRDDSATRAFYDRGWSGLTVEPEPGFAALQRAERPRDTLVEAAVTSRPGAEITLHVVPGTGLSTIVESVSDRHHAAGIELVDVAVRTARLDSLLEDAGWTAETDIHFMLIDVEGAEHDVLRSVDLRRWRPWVLVVESTAPNSTEATHGEWEPDVLAAGYQLCLFDGLSRFYVAAEHPELTADLSYPACVLDHYLPRATAGLLEERAELLAQTAHWRSLALGGWADAVARAGGSASRSEVDRLRGELEAMRPTLSWRVTLPLRAARRAIDQVRGR